MSPYKRNTLVGVTVLLALGLLGYMIIQFGGRLAGPFSGEKMTVTIAAERADALSVGSPVQFLGVTVGQVSKLELTDDFTLTVEAQLDADKKIPGNVVGRIRQTNLLSSGAVVQLEVEGGAEPTGVLGAGDVVTTDYTGNQIIPDEIGELATSLNELVAEFRASGLIDDTKTLINNTNTQVTRAGDALASMQAFIDDPELRQRIDETIENARLTSASARSAMAKFDAAGDEVVITISEARSSINDTAGRVAGSLTELDKSLDNIQSITAKIDNGEGTIGMLVNDEKLYNALLDVLRQADAVSRDTQRLIQQLEQEGFKVGF
ncbi:MAG: MlaD family protein [Planctomycetota bacterium]